MTEIRKRDGWLPAVPPTAQPVSPVPASPAAAGPEAPATPAVGDTSSLAADATALAPPPLTTDVPRLPGSTTPELWTFDTRSAPLALGQFTLVKSLSGDFELQTQTEAGPAGPLTMALAVKVNAAGTIVTFDARRRALALNGLAFPAPRRGETKRLRGGGGLTSWGRGFFSVDSEAGDSVSFFDQDGFLDVTGHLAPARSGEAYGQLGAFGVAPPTPRTLLTAEGDEVTDEQAFLDSWRVRPANSLWGQAGPDGSP